MELFTVLKSKDILQKTDAKSVITTTLQNQHSAVYDGLIEYKGLSLVQEHEQATRDTLYKKASSLKSTVRSSSVSDNIENIRHLKQRELPERTQLVNSLSSEIDTERKAKYEKEASLSKFREENKLQHPASYSENPSKVWGILLFAMIIEGIFNSFFLGKANEFGIAGGFALAFIFSIINLVFAKWCVLGYQLSQHINQTKSLKGILLILVCCLTVGAVALFVGHYRSAIDIDIDNASFLALENFIQNPFGISTFESWILTLITIAIYFSFIFTISKIDDKYPEYGDKTRETLAAKAEFAKKEAKANKMVNEAKSSLLESLENSYESLNSIAKQLDEDYEGLLSLERNYRSFLLLQQSEFTTYCAECRQRFSHECTQILDSSADLSIDKPNLHFIDFEGVLSESDIRQFGEVRHQISHFQSTEFPSLKTDFQESVNQLTLMKGRQR